MNLGYLNKNCFKHIKWNTSQDVGQIAQSESHLEKLTGTGQCGQRRHFAETLAGPLFYTRINTVPVLNNIQ